MGDSNELSERYLDLLKGCLTRALFIDEESRNVFPHRVHFLNKPFEILRSFGVEIGRHGGDIKKREEGADWPRDAETMIGLKRLDNIQSCIRQIVNDEIEGDLIETGVWRGGASIMMRGALEAYGDKARTVWAADSFEGLPKTDPKKYPKDKDLDLSSYSELAVSVESVKDNFRKYGLLDDRVKFLVGWFKDTLPTAPIEKLSLMRLDGDYYESTMDAFVNLYQKLSVGGFVIVDDYLSHPACKAATDDFRKQNAIEDEITNVDRDGVFWRRSK